ncbi:hypothetical protein JXM67_00990 [candidate division WOR-3 bacterium]|nr:hypothetical protein [candidate division WOR-3 bacterium]
MKRVISILVLGIAILLAQDLDTEKEGAGGVVVGEGFMIALGAPPGWIFETKLAVAMGSRVVIYPADEDLGTTPVMIHANAFPLDGLSLEAWLAQDISSLEDEYPGIKITVYPDLVTADSLTAVVRGFDPAESDYPLIERIAYIRIGKHVAIISLSAETKEACEDAIDEFEYVVAGFSDFKKTLNQAEQEN